MGIGGNACIVTCKGKYIQKEDCRPSSDVDLHGFGKMHVKDACMHDT